MDEVSHRWLFATAADREVRHAKLVADPAWQSFAQTYGHLLVSRRQSAVAAGILFAGLRAPELN